MEQDQATDSGAPGEPSLAVSAEPSLGNWVAARRAKLEILLIGGIAIGGIVCMMLVVVYAVWLSRQP